MANGTGLAFPHLSWWTYAVFFLLVLCFLIYHYFQDVLTQLGAEFGSIGVLLAKLLGDIGKFFFQLFSILWTIWGLLFAFRWRVQYAVRYIFVSTALGFLALGGFYLCAELAFAVTSGLRSDLPRFYQSLVALSLRIPQLHDWLAKTRMPQVPELPFRIEAVLFLIALLTLRHHWHEFKASRRREAIPPALEELFLEFDKFRKQNPVAAKEIFFEILLKKMKEVLEKNTRRDVAFSIMEAEEAPDPKNPQGKVKTGFLKITFLPKDSPLDRTLRLEFDAGGAGRAYRKKVSIYIPSVRHRIGIDLEHEKSVGVTYKKGPNDERLRSILSVPVLVSATRDPVAVISVSSKKHNAFRPEDFEIVSLAAAIVSTLY